MKKLVLLFITLICIGALSAEALNFMDLKDMPITEDILREVNYRNSLVRGYGWQAGTPGAIPIAPDVFLEDNTWEFDFEPYVSVNAGTTLNELQLGWSQSSFFTISAPYPAQPFKLRFVPNANFFGTKPVWVTLYRLDGTNLIDPVSKGINVTVTNDEDLPSFHFPTTSTPGNVSSGYQYSMQEDTLEGITINFGNIVTIYDGSSYNIYITQTTFPPRVNITQNETNDKIATFIPVADYSGVQYFIVTAVENLPGGVTQHTSTSFSIEVTPINDPPTVSSYLPTNDPTYTEPVTDITIVQDDLVNFSITGNDVDAEPLFYTWTLSGSLNGAPFSTVESTTDVLNYTFNVPGIYTLVCEIRDRADGSGYSVNHQWNIVVSPEGPWFAPWGSNNVTTFSTSQNVTLSTPGIDDTVIYYYTTAVPPVVPAIGSLAEPQIYNGPINIPIPPQDYVYTITAWFTHPSLPESVHKTQVYNMTGMVATPQFVEAAGLYPSNVDFPVHITCATPGASIYYSLDNGVNWLLYNSGTGVVLAPHTVSNIVAYASNPGWDNSAISPVHQYDIRRQVIFAAPVMDTYPLPDINGDYCVCLYDSVEVNFTPPIPVPAGASIRYSINGDEYVYNPADFPLAIYHTSTITWWAEYNDADPDYIPSTVHTFSIPVKNRTRLTMWPNGTVFDPPSGTYTSPQNVFINTNTDPPNAPIYYSLNGAPYQLYNSGAINISANASLEVYADPMPVLTTLQSLHQTANYVITGTLPTPIIAPVGYPAIAMYESNVNVSISLPVGDPRWAAANIYYTTDGTIPTSASTLYAGPFVLDQGHWQVRAIAILNTWLDSPVALQQYYVKFLPEVTFLPTATEHYANINVEMFAYDGAQIRYTDDGSEPHAGSPIYAAPIPLMIDPDGTYNKTYRAKAYMAGWVTSDTAQKNYTMIPTVPNPVITANLPGLVHETPIEVSLTDPLAGVQIYYTLNGADPDQASTLYTVPFTLTTTTTVRARAYKAGYKESQIVEITYIVGNNIGALVFQPTPGTYYDPIDVTISTNPPAARIYYTTNGDEPTIASTEYTGAIHLGFSASSVTIKALAVLENWTESRGTATYKVTDVLDTPVITPGSGEYAVGSNVNVNITVPNGTIRYSIDGAAPQIYARAFDVSRPGSGTITITAWAYVDDASYLTSEIATAVYTFNGQLNAPIITHVSGTYAEAINVRLFNYQNATMYYSTDNGLTYNEYTSGLAGFPVDVNTTIRAYAAKSNWQDSPVVTATYNFKVPNPVFNPSSNSFALPFDASISVVSGDRIYYTLDGSNPTLANPNAQRYTVPIAVGYGYTRIRAMAHRAGWTSSDVVEVIYNVNGQLAAPLLSLASGLFYDNQNVSISTVPENARIYYTVDGTEPTEGSNLYGGVLNITQSTELKVKAFLAGWVPSNTVTASYELKVKPVSSPLPATVYTTPQDVTLATLTPGTVIHYTLDGSVPTELSLIYGTHINVSATTRIRARAYKNDGLTWTHSDEFDQTYAISQQVATPIFNLPGGVYGYSPVPVTISSTTPGARVWYAYEGEGWQEYTIPLQIDETKIVYAKAEKDGWVPSPTVYAHYIISIPVVATPYFVEEAGISYLPGTYNNAVDVKLASTTPGAQIYYTLNGADPTESDNLCMAPFTINATTTVKAKAFNAPNIPSGILTGIYRIEPLTVLSPIVVPEDDVSPFYEPFYVFMYPRTTDSVIHYTTNGNDPTETDSTYNAPFMLNATTSIKARAFKNGFSSDVVIRNYTITGKVNISGLTVSPASGIYTTPQTISVAGALNPITAVLRYTTDGSDPTPLSPLFDTLNPSMNSVLNLKIRGFLDNWLPSDVISANYTFTGQVMVSADFFSLDPLPIYTTSQNLTLNTVTNPAGATLRYTLDGSDPTELSPAYIAGTIIPITTTTTVKAKAFMLNWLPSEVQTATYTITGQVILGNVIPESGTVINPQNISFTLPTPGDAAVYYTTNGTIPTQASTLYSGAFVIDANDVIDGNHIVNLKIKAFKANWDASDVLNEFYTFKTGTPQFSLASGVYPSAQVLNLSSLTNSATIRYTLDGSEPNETSLLYAAPIPITQSVTVKARAYNGDYLASEVSSATYVMGTNQLVALPTFTPEPGIYSSVQSVSINCATPGATIYYRTDGLDPTESDTPFLAPIAVPLNSTLTIKARAYKEGFITSQVATATYTVTNQVQSVSFNPPSGSYTQAKQIVLTCPTDGAYILYTTGIGAPDTPYTNAIYVADNSSMTIKAQAFKDGWAASDVTTATYTITGTTSFNQPLLTPAPGTFTGPQVVTIAEPIPAAAAVWYTLDGSVPSPTNPNALLYVGPFVVDGNVNLQVGAYLDGWDPQLFTSNVYTFNVAAPWYTPTPGYYADPIDVSIQSSTPGVTIYYTTNGDVPTTLSPVYNVPISINGNTTFKAIATKAGYNSSPIIEGIYGVGGAPIPTVASPVFDPIAGTYTSPRAVSISTSTPGALIRYTLNGEVPTAVNGLVYNPLTPIQLGTDTYTMLRAIAYMEDGSYYASPVATAEYTITGQVADVVFTPPAGTYSTPQTVFLSNTTPGSFFRYTLDGSEPTENSPLYSTTGIYIAMNSSVVIKAKGYKPGWLSSNTTTATYNVRGVSFSLNPVPGNYNNAQSVSVVGLNPANAVILYSIDGSEPSIPYTGGISLNGGIDNNGVRVLKVKGSLDTWSTYEVTGNYVFYASVPTFSPQAGTYDSPRVVSLNSLTTDAIVRYTIDGSTPSLTVGEIYNGTPIAVNENMTVRAIAFKDGYIPSAVVSATYAIGSVTPVVVNPVFNPGTTTSFTPLNVSISTTTPNTTIYYTTNGDDPTPASMVYNMPILIPGNTNMFIKARAYRENWLPSAIVSANYVVTGTVASVAFAPLGGTYQTEQYVQLSTTTDGAVIRYTTDGTEPNNTSPVYNSAIVVPLNTNGMIITAKAFRNGWQTSPAVAQTYNVTGQVTILDPVFSPMPGTYTTSQSILIGISSPAGATLRYTLDGTDPTPTSNAYSVGSIVLPTASTTTIKVRAYLANWEASPVYTATYTITGQVGLPSNMFDPVAGIYQTPQTVHLMGNTIPSGAILRYTLNGGEPNELSPAYDQVTGISINGSSILRVRGFISGWIPSETASATYTITGQVVFNAPVFTPAAGAYTTAQMVVIGGTTPSNAQRRYTTDGSEPTINSMLYTNDTSISIPLGSVTTIKVKAFLDDWTPSATQTAVYNVTGQVIMTDPVFSPSPDVYTTPIAVVINNVTMPVDAVIRYTTDGSDPNETSTIYTQPIQVGANQSITIRTRAFKDGWLPSAISTGVYNVTGQVQITGTVFTPDPSIIYTSAQNVVISTSTNTLGAIIRYTTNGNEPGENSPIYSQPINLGLNTTTEIKVKAFKTGWTSSPTYSAIYTITGQVNIAGVSITPVSGTYQTVQTITTTGSLVPNDAVLRYTTDGTDPVQTSPLFSTLNPPLNSSLNLKIRGFKANWLPSPVLNANYNFTGQVVLSTPMFTPAAGTYNVATSVSLNTLTVPAGATLRYTLNGNDPTESSPAYNTAIALPMNATTTVKVRGFLAGWTPSTVLSAQYVMTGALDIAMPRFTPSADSYYTAQNVSLGNSIILGTATVATGATIRYTTDGTEPSISSTPYNPAEPIAIAASTTLKIKSFKTDWIPSPTYEAVYTITGQVSISGVTVNPPAGTYQTLQTIGYTGAPSPSDSQLRYTTDGSDPVATSPIFSTLTPELNTSLNLKIRGFKPNWLPSPVMNLNYLFTGQVAITSSVFTPNPAIVYTSAQNVVISTTTNTLGAVIHYTTNGDEPTEASPIYSQPIPLGTNSVTVIKAKAYKPDWAPSQTYTATYHITGKIEFAGTLFSLDSQTTYTEAKEVRITAEVYPEDAVVHYTTDGSIPNETSPIFDELTPSIALPVNSITVIQAKAFKTDWIESDVISATFRVTGQVVLSEPSFSPGAGTYTTQQSVTIANAQLPGTGVTIRYTLDGTEPTSGSPAYVNPITLPMATVTEIKIKGFADGWIPSDTHSAVFNITGTVAAPIFSRASNQTYGADFKLGISCATPGAVIRYTMDGSDVTSSSAVYEDSLSIDGAQQDWVVKAQAFKTDWVNSSVTIGNFKILHAPINVWTEMYDTHIRILWNLPSLNRGLDGFNVYRKRAVDSSFPNAPLNATPVSDMIGGNYYYDDYAIVNNTIYQYMVKAVYDGVESPPSNIDDGQLISPNLVISETSKAFPNPAETSTTIRVVLSRNDNVQLSVSIYDFAGKKVRTLSVPSTITNKVEIAWDLKNSAGVKVARGAYFARVVVSDSQNQFEKVIKIAVK